MMELSRESVICFLQERGGRVANQHLLEHFRGLLTEPPPGEPRTAIRQRFKDIVNDVATVHPEDGVRYVCLRKKYRTGSAPSPGEQQPGAPVPPSSEHADEKSGEPETESLSPSPVQSPGLEPPPSISVTEPTQESPELPVQDTGSQSVRLCPGSPEVCRGSGRTPRGSRRSNRDPVSPQLRRGGGLLRTRDSDSSSLHSSSSVSGNEDDDNASGTGSVSGPAALDPLEHAWMLSSCQARWESLQELLSTEPGLISRRDFITGFSCLHWAAKHGQHELLAALLTHARKHRVPVNINARAAGGYTALHLAAMHGHLEVIKLLVGAYDAEVDIRDYSGRKAWQYLSTDTARDIQGLVGAQPGEEEEEDGGSTTGRWRFSKVLPTQLIVHRLSQLPEEEHDGPSLGRSRADISRKGSGGRAKPRMNKIRFRTQIIHTNLSAKDPEEEDDRPLKSPMRHRPKSNVFG
ncbi:ankyrin repeat domain-containing protein SOWAHC [Spea bombifrons]|uniref:ankyrin repeat domain-containing protein SOWAHC n=1 Tax=Spea bombifrons TaxID=233779 RepID=UPI00234AB4AD|nr:ankyrin repeat domain-containing protein SOWAHC [Spea bombifrons]